MTLTDLGTPAVPLAAADCLVVANPAAGSVTPDVVAAVGSRLAAHTRSVRTVWTEGPGDAAAKLTAVPDADLVVAVGGDGTVLDLLQALAPRQVLCPLPAGSGNSTARNVFGDRTWDEVLDLLDRPGAVEVRTLDLLRLVEPGVLAVLGASTGFLAAVLVGARDVDPSLSGMDRYFAASAGVMAAMPDHPTRVTVDGVVLREARLSSVAVGGGSYRARFFRFLPDSVLDDGLLDVSTIDALDAQAVQEMVPLITEGTHVGRPDVHNARGRRVVVERTDGAPLVAEFDGSVWDAAGPRLTVEIVPGALRTLAASTPAATH